MRHLNRTVQCSPAWGADRHNGGRHGRRGSMCLKLVYMILCGSIAAGFVRQWSAPGSELEGRKELDPPGPG